MAACGFKTLLLSVFLLISNFEIVFSQSESINDNAFDSLDGLGCGRFRSLIEAGGEAMIRKYKGGQPLTLFVFNDSAATAMPNHRQVELFNMESGNTALAREYVSSFTIDDPLDTNSFSKDIPYRTASMENRVLFLRQKKIQFEEVGPTSIFCNGALVIRPNIKAGRHIIHVLDRFLELQWPKTALAYVSGSNPNSLIYRFYEELFNALMFLDTGDPITGYNQQVHKVLMYDQVTFFLPTNEAMADIPQDRLAALLSNRERLLDIVTLHIIPNDVVYTSIVGHNENFLTQKASGSIFFRKSSNREAVYVTGFLKRNSPVTAKLTTANITVLNGVVHQIDNVLGFVYRSAIEEIEYDPELTAFNQLLRRAREELRNYVTTNAQVIIFAPIRSALVAVNQVYPNYINNLTLVNMVVQYSLLQPQEQTLLTEYNRGYNSLISVISQFNGQRIKIYSEGNDTWVEGGYVRARVIKPDIGVTNGLVHQIDAVFGVPTRDVTHTIMCEDRLEKMYQQLVYTELNMYLHDPAITANQPCIHRASGQDGYTQTGGGKTEVPPFNKLCREGRSRCDFTFFVPNDTALISFRDSHSSSSAVMQVMNDMPRWRYILQRLMTSRERIYIDQRAPGSRYIFRSDSGDEIVLQIGSRSNAASGITQAYIMFQGVRADIIHSDIGATNGVIHIINNILFVSQDVYRDISGASMTQWCLTLLIVSSLFSLLHNMSL